MPRGPKGEKPPADVVGNAVHVIKTATGEVADYGITVAVHSIIYRHRVHSVD